MAVAKSVVLEFGENDLRGGFAGEATPRFSLVHGLAGSHPNTRVQLNELFQKVFIKHLQIKPKVCDVLVVEQFLSTGQLRDHVLSVLLRDCQVHSVSIQPDLLMGALSSGASSGVVVHVGGASSQALCFVKSRPLIHTLREATIGITQAATEFNSSLNALLERTVSADGSAVLFHKVACEGSALEDVEMPPMQGVSNVTFTVPGLLRFACLQCILTGYTNDGDCVDENGGVVGMLLESLKACNNDIRQLATTNVIVMGKAAEIPRLADAICRTATAQALSQPEYAQNVRATVQNKLPEQRMQCVPTAFPRASLAWVGGSLFASLKENKSAYVTLQDLIQRGNYSPHNAGSTLACIPTALPTAPLSGSACAEAGITPPTVPVPVSVPVGASEKDPFLLSAPDWQSLSEKDWAFCRANASAGVPTASI